MFCKVEDGSSGSAARPQLARLVPLLALVALLAACTANGGPGDISAAVDPTSTSTTGPGRIPDARSRCPRPTLGQAVRVADPGLSEISGAVLSPSDRTILWVHEDSGNDPVLTALAPDGTTAGSYVVSGVRAVDWEDIASGTGPDGSHYLFVADIGDNRAQRGELLVHRIAAPEQPFEGGSVRVDATIPLRLAAPADAEALLVDPATGDLVVVTKDLTGDAEVHVAPATAWDAPDGPVTMEHRGTVSLGLLSPVLAGDVSADGRQVVLRTPTGVVWWRRAEGTSLAEVLLGEDRCHLPGVVDVHGEAVALHPDGGYVLVGEGDAEIVRAR